MKLAIGCDHRGLDLKTKLAKRLSELGIEFDDLGCFNQDAVDYPDVAGNVARGIVEGKYERGLLVCGTGNGMAMTANRFPGVRAALCHNEEEARLVRAHNDSNVICFGANMVEPASAIRLLEVWLRTEFEGGRHQRRVEKIDAVSQNFRECK